LYDKLIKEIIMNNITGITIERTGSGTPAYIKFDYGKYGKILQSMFQEKGLDYPVEDSPNSKTEAAIKEARNYKKLKRFDSVESLLEECLK
jgi:hypothetical protein